MYKHKIELGTMADIANFIKIVSDVQGNVRLVDGTGFCVNGKSLLGAVATMEWNSVYCESDTDIYSKIQKFCIAA